MRALTETELERMQGAQESAMFDRCDIWRLLSFGTDKYGKPTQTWVVNASYVACGLWLGYPTFSSREALGLTQVAELDAVLRLPLGTDVTNLDRVKVTYRLGVEQDSPLMYEVKGPVLQGPSGIRVGLKLVTA